MISMSNPGDIFDGTFRFVAWYFDHERGGDQAMDIWANNMEDARQKALEIREDSEDLLDVEIGPLRDW